MMVALYVDGQRVGTLADAERLIPDLIGRGKTVELREDTGNRRIGLVTPEQNETLVPWELTLTPEEARRRIEEPGGMTLAEFRKRQGKG
jgi:hypothetical protein